MQEALDFVSRHGGSVVFAILFVDQLGVPLPSVPVLLAIGALAGTGRIDPLVAFGAAVAGSLLADTVWYAIGRWKGPKALAWLCRVSLEPDTCVAKTQGMFARYGLKSLAFAKFVPGYDTVAPPLAGTMRVPTGAFLVWSAVGATLFVGAFAGVGLVLGHRRPGTGHGRASGTGRGRASRRPRSSARGCWRSSSLSRASRCARCR
jgi:membrane protein DedA with SNARE-associated domain